jgi:GTP-binding protein
MKKIKNIAIIAHVDHGKTTIVDKLLVNSGLFRDNQEVAVRMMDSNDLEKERGITILAKNTAIDYKDYHINILDTPGHADFGGEVERILKMVDGVLLVVDAFEGCMPQTRFVLKKAMEQHLRPIVIVNKVDKPQARCEEVIDEVMDLLIELGADDDQLDFPVVYASAINGQSGLDYKNMDENMDAIYDSIIEHIEDAPQDVEAPLQLQVSLLDYDNYVGRIGIGRITQGTVKVGQTVALSRNDDSVQNFRVTKLYGFSGLNRIEVQEASAGEIVAIVGKDDINVSETVCNTDNICPMPPLLIDEPTLQMEFIVNDSPMAGREGKFVTARKIEERLMLQLQTDVSLRVTPTESPSRFIISGRGELHLAILIENMRREGYELQVAKPRVILKEVDGRTMEPVEEVMIDVPDDYVGAVIQAMGDRKGEMVDMKNMHNGTTRLQFICYSRALIGFTTEFITMTKGYGIYNHTYLEYRDILNAEIKSRYQGVLVSIDSGKTTPYSMIKLEDRGTMIVEPGTEVYEGMIIGINNKLGDLDVNVTKAKEQTNVRSANKDQTVSIKRPKLMSLEQYIEFLEDDELLEVTPESIRLRKRFLNKNERAKAMRELKFKA